MTDNTNFLSGVKPFTGDDETIQTPDSSNIAAYGYVPSRSVLFVEFKNGARFEYDKVPPSVFEEMKQAESIGKFVHSRVKGYFEGRKVS